MRHHTFLKNKIFINPPNGISIFMSDRTYNDMVECLFDMDNLEHVNFVRRAKGKQELKTLKGYCMSSGCSCRHQNGSKGRPDCGLFKEYESDGIKRDFIYQIFGI